MRLKLTILLKHGMTVSGCYAWPEALRVLKFASAQDNFEGFYFSEAI